METQIRPMTRREHNALHRLSAGAFEIEETCYGVRYVTERDPRIDPTVDLAGHERFVYVGERLVRTEFLNEASHMSLAIARSVLVDLKVLSYKPGGNPEWAKAEIFRFGSDL